MLCGRRGPHSTEQTCDRNVLVRFRQRAKRGSRLAALEQHHVETFVRREHAHGWVAVPEAQSLNLMLAFHVRHAQFEDRRRAAGEVDCGDVRTCYVVADEGRTKTQRPAAREVVQRIGETLEPCRALGALAAIRCQIIGDSQGLVART